MADNMVPITDRLEAFVWVARTQSVSGAAKRSGIPPATLSGRITALEVEVGKLFERSSRGTTWILTELGETILVDAQHALEQLRRIRSAKSLPRERPVRLAIIQSVEHTWYKPWRSALHASHPDIAFELTVDTTENVVDLVKRGLLDAGVSMRPYVDARIDCQELRALPMAFIGNADVYSDRSYEFSEFAGRLLTFQRGSLPYRQVIEVIRAEPGFRPHLELCSSIPSMIDAVECNRGVATLPHALVTCSRSTQLRALRCNVTLDPLSLWLSWPKNISGAHAKQVVESLQNLRFETPLGNTVRGHSGA